MKFRFALVVAGTIACLLSHASGSRAGSPDGLLYDQTDQFYFGSYEGAPVNDYLHPSDIADSSEGADDFLVTDQAGWTVSGFKFLGGALRSDGTPADPTAANLAIYADLNGAPATTPLCSASGVSVAVDTTLDPPFYAVTLPAPCALPRGRYWVAMQFLADARIVQMNYWSPMSEPDSAHGWPGVWRNPANGLGSDCAVWGSLSKCNLTHSYWNNPATAEFVFQVIGHVGTTPGGIALAVTAAAADSAHPDACGSATMLDVTPGDAVNLCYRVTNDSGIDLPLQSLTDSIDGTIFAGQPVTVPNGASYQFNRVVTIGSETQRVATWTAQDQAPGYLVDDTLPADFIDLNASPTASHLDVPYGREDDWSTAVFLPGSFPLFGQDHDVICVGNNGYILAASSASTITCPLWGLWDITPLPNAQFPYAAILPSWVDLFTSGYVMYDRQGDTPQASRYMIEWFAKNRDAADSVGTLTFEVVIDAATGEIVFNYQSMAFDDSLSPMGDYGQAATVGLQQDSTHALTYSYRSPQLTNGHSIRWTPNSPATFTASATVQFNQGAPVISALPGAIDATAPAGGSASATLTIANSGDRPLSWSIDQVPSNSHFPAIPRHFVAPMGDPSETTTRSAPRRAPKASDAPGASETSRSAIIGVPTYVLTYDVLYQERGFGSLDAESAGTLNLIAPGPMDPAPFPDGGYHSVEYTAASFANNDFSKQYVLDRYGAFGSIDTATGAFSLINGEILDLSCAIGHLCWSGLRWDPATSTMYAVAGMEPSDESGISSQLFTIDLATGAIASVGEPMDGIILLAIAIDPQGLLFGLDGYNDQLVAIDKTSGEFQPVGSIGFDANYDQDMDFDPSTGILWYAGVNTQGALAMFTIDPHTGLATYSSPLPPYTEVLSMAIAVPSGPCGRPSDSPWLHIDATDGVTAPGSASEVGLAFDASALAPGHYAATVCIPSNDPTYLHHPLPVPVTFDVGGADVYIFRDGFEPAAE